MLYNYIVGFRVVWWCEINISFCFCTCLSSCKSNFKHMLHSGWLLHPRLFISVHSIQHPTIILILLESSSKFKTIFNGWLLYSSLFNWHRLSDTSWHQIMVLPVSPGIYYLCLHLHWRIVSMCFLVKYLTGCLMIAVS